MTTQNYQNKRFLQLCYITKIEICNSFGIGKIIMGGYDLTSCRIFAID